MTLPPLRRQLLVQATPERAYQVFTEQLGTWWPLAWHSVYEHHNMVSFEGDEIVERSVTGESNVWGRVTDADPPHRIAFSWHPGREDERGTVEVTFVPAGDDRTLMTLVHDGWESYGDAAISARDEYGTGWPRVLAAFGDVAASPRPQAEEQRSVPSS
jgi:uncharacterized protein YndB with AHSA1/START domain